MNKEKELNFYTAKFRNSLIGKWETIEGSFKMQYDSFEFFENGKGIWISSGLGYHDKINFEWRKKGDFVIEMKFEENNLWETISYSFKKIKTDKGNRFILCQNKSEAFYLAVTKIGYVETV